MKKTKFKPFEFFKEECIKWIKTFGLSDIWWMFEEVEGTFDGRWAQVLYDHDSKAGTVSLNSEIYENDNIEDMLSYLAFHEICETMLIPLNELMTENLQERARHTVVNRIGNALNVNMIIS